MDGSAGVGDQVVRGQGAARAGMADLEHTRHTIVVASSGEDLVEQVLPILQSVVARDEPLSVNLAPSRLEALQEQMGSSSARVSWTDTTSWMPHPVRRLRALEELAVTGRERGAARHWFVGEFPFPDDRPDLALEWERFDALLSDVLADGPVRMICVYDASVVPKDVVERAHSSHPQVGVRPVADNPALEPVEHLLQCWSPDSLPVPGHAVRIDGEVRPATARALLREGPAAALDPERHEELTIVVSELVTNAWRAGATSVGVACWHEGGELVMQVDDDGPGLNDPFAGYHLPSLDADNGRGLWIARQLADVVQIAPRRPGTSVRVRLACQLRRDLAGGRLRG